MLFCVITAIAQKHSHVPECHDGTLTSKSPNFSSTHWETCVYSTPYSALLDFWSDLMHTLGTWPFAEPCQLSIVYFHPFIFVQPVIQATAKKSMMGYLPAAYGPLIHTIFLVRISTPILYHNPHFLLNLNKEKGFLQLLDPAADAHISAIYTDEAVIQTATIFPAFNYFFWGNKVS